MGQLSNPFNNLSNITGDFICNKCNAHLLLELIQTKNEILIRSYCCCGTLTSCINQDIPFFLKRYDFYKGYRCHQILKLTEYGDTNITKYCLECKQFFCDECSSKHKHKTFIEAKNYFMNCRFHRDCRLVAFCKTCKISVCNKCIEYKFHPKHDIKYENDLNDISDKVKIFEENLKTAFIKMNELIKMKYGQESEIKVANLFNPQKITSKFDNNEKEIILCLELLKTFLDIYNYKSKNNIVNYQAISHILKHKDFKIIRLKDNSEKKEAPSSRIISIGSDNNRDNNLQKQSNGNFYSQIKNIFISDKKFEETNEFINIYLKIDLQEKETRNNEIDIEFEKILNTNNFFIIKKLILLKNGNLAVCYINNISIFKNFEEVENNIEEKNIIDFVELDNENISILKEDFLIIYKKMKNNEYEKIQNINLQANSNNYYKIKNISNNIALLSYIKKEKSILTFFSYSNYTDYKLNEIKLLDIDYEGDMVEFGNLIIICFGTLDTCIIFFYNVDNGLLDSNIIESYQTYKKAVKCFKINEDKILVSTVHTGIIFNIKTRQVETFIEGFKNLNYMVKVGDYTLVGLNNIISQINFKTGRLYNKYRISFEKKSVKYYDISDIVDVGNNKFIISNGTPYICQFNYTT